jgi:O-acetyl-ADP-ribose deacetylase (regulator of RNase III)
MHLYLGEIYKIPCDAIVIGQVESLTDRLDGNDVIFTLAGIELEPELATLAPCTTGDSVITRGWQMPCDWIIHSVGPRYDERYLNASDHALFSAYKSALVLAADKEVKRLVIGAIYKQSKNYPRFDAAHVALRTVRKFLEHSVGDVFEKVMFCVNTQEDFEIYSALMHAYFPRTQEELEVQANLLPIELGDEWGEVVIPDRVVKVSAGPKPLPTDEMVQYRGSEEVKRGDSSKATRKLGGLSLLQ